MKPARPQLWTVNEDDHVDVYESQRPLPIRDFMAEQLPVVFQPIVDLRTRRLFAVEGLVRCTVDPFRSPPALLDAAVEQAAVGHLGRVIREVAFERAAGIPLFVNVHPNELATRWLVRTDDPMSFHDAPIFLEVTESATFEHHDLCMSVLKEVCTRTGAKLVVDDFGAGYSNLERIAELEPAVIKLDLALIRGIDVQPRKQILVAHLVKLCVALGAKVVCEGIETADELSAVVDTGAHYGQGYLLARPAFPIPDVSWPAGLR